MKDNGSTHVLMTADAMGGVWTYSMDLIKALHPYNVTVTLVVFGREPSDAQVKEAKSLPNCKLKVAPYRLEWMINPWHDVEESCAYLKDLAEEIQPDLIHLNTFPQAPSLDKWPVITVVHSCVLSWWRAVKGEEPPVEWDFYKQVVEQGLHSSDLIIAPTEYIAQTTREIYNPEKGVEVIYNGRDYPVVPTAKKQQIIFSMGRLWDEAKNLKLLLKAAPMVSHAIYIAGETNYNQEILPKNVKLLGKLLPEEIRGWLNIASVYALPVKYEPFGLSFLEAAASGCALVAGDTPSLREVWGEAAAFVDPNDPYAFADTCNLLLRDDQERETLVNRSRKRAKYFTVELMAGKYVQRYQQLIGSHFMNKQSNLKLKTRVSA